jgi:hypothetical protein
MPYSGTFAAAGLPAPFISSIHATMRSRAFQRANPMTSCRPRPMSPSSSYPRPPCRPRSPRRRRRARRSASFSPQGLAAAPARLPISAGRSRARWGCASLGPIASACWCRGSSSTRALPPQCRRPAISRLSPSPAPLLRDWSNGGRRRESDFPRQSRSATASTSILPTFSITSPWIAQPAPFCSTSNPSATHASSCRRRGPRRVRNRYWWSNPDGRRSAPRRRSPTPERWPGPTRSMTPHSGARGCCACSTSTNCSPRP